MFKTHEATCRHIDYFKSFSDLEKEFMLIKTHTKFELLISKIFLGYHICLDDQIWTFG